MRKPALIPARCSKAVAITRLEYIATSGEGRGWGVALHLVETSGGRLVEGLERGLRPTVTFRQQRHGQEDLDRGGSERHADLGISLRRKAPFERGSDIVDAGEM